MLKSRWNTETIVHKMIGVFATKLWAAALLYLLPSQPTFGQANLPPMHLGTGRLDLHASTTWVTSSLTIDDGALIVTNGNTLSIIIIGGDLKVTGTAKIIAFDDSKRALTNPIPLTAARGTDGITHDRGSGSDGAGSSRPGADGGRGGDGALGVNGLDGLNAGAITIAVTGTASGNIQIDNRGTDGQNGGRGGDGGNSGNGQQGGRAVTNRGPFGVPLGCASGPGNGGNGGDAGNGGSGGNGGDGGHGGNLYFVVKLKDANLKLDYRLDKGKSGQPGKAGQPGNAGLFGYGGRGNVGCDGREEQRKGHNGRPGIAGHDGHSGVPSEAGEYSDNAKSIPAFNNQVIEIK